MRIKSKHKGINIFTYVNAAFAYFKCTWNEVRSEGQGTWDGKGQERIVQIVRSAKTAVQQFVYVTPEKWYRK